MQPITRLVFILLFSTMLLFQVKVSAQENNLVSESQSLQKIELLQDSVSESPQQQVVTLSSIINTCRENDWQQAYLYASMLKIELLLDIEHVNEAEAIFSQLTSTANQVLDPEISIRLDVAQLRINDAKGLLLDIKKLHESLLAKADKIESHKLAGQVYLAVGNSLYNNSDNIGALKALRNAYTAYETANDLSGLGYVYNTLANVNGDLKNNDIAIEYLEKALTISRTRNDKFSQSINLYNIGNTYIIIGNAKKAREYLGLAMQASIHINDDIGVSWAKKALADIDIEEKNGKVQSIYSVRLSLSLLKVAPLCLYLKHC
ncbi:tetratricopeptide repeat protein [Paraglaciecola aquimarina]|uniref:Tetratricopeptide repeat protein n=1 Tax=Paraglaciecola aquimarina TaxID=1235557 RepID=A0ABU3T0Q4_9ALTE|nr:tetratricopeptide repeat protein [Paraglaciecola aquimarina]MDU0355848.1 tetratricopeptide repeat protein [Paraglaciecola aquimarina]